MNAKAKPLPGPFDFFILVASVLAIALLAFEAVAKPNEEVLEALWRVDLILCCIFLFDFAVRLAKAKSRIDYLKWGWIDLVSSIPMVGALRAGRAFRIIRILRLLRGIRAARIIAPLLTKRRADTGLAAALSVMLLAVSLSSIAVLYVETAPESNIVTGADAVWWSVVTVTTVGYGDFYPVTTAGRVISIGLMLVGIGMFGTLSGYVASWFMKPEQDENEDVIREVLTELRDLRQQLGT